MATSSNVLGGIRCLFVDYDKALIKVDFVVEYKEE